MNTDHIDADFDECQAMRAALAAVPARDLMGLSQRLALFVDRPGVVEGLLPVMNRAGKAAETMGGRTLVAIELGVMAAMSVDPHMRASLALYIAIAIMAKAAAHSAAVALDGVAGGGS